MIAAAAASNGEGGSIVELKFDLPATYRIRVKGYLDDRWSDRLGGMAIKAIGEAEGAAQTILVGWLPDQAALCGVLITLYDLHLPLVSVELVSANNIAEM
jgi:hypothetical protein